MQKLSYGIGLHSFCFLKIEMMKVKGKGLSASTIKTELTAIRFSYGRIPYARLQYGKFIKEGYSEYEARKKVSELLGHHCDDVTRIYLAE